MLTTIPPWILWAVAGAAGLLALDRLLLWMERRGWVYWRKKKPNPGTAGSALLQMQALLEPEKQHVVDVRRDLKKKQQRDEDDEGDE